MKVKKVKIVGASNLIGTTLSLCRFKVFGDVFHVTKEFKGINSGFNVTHEKTGFSVTETQRTIARAKDSAVKDLMRYGESKFRAKIKKGTRIVRKNRAKQFFRKARRVTGLIIKRTWQVFCILIAISIALYFAVVYVQGKLGITITL